MRTSIGSIATVLLVGCGGQENPPTTTPRNRPDAVRSALGFEPLAFKIVDDNLRHDTLLTQVTLDMSDGSFVMVASNVEETFEGLRLYHYRFAVDSAVNMLAVSNPGYDSWTMLPTFFPTDTSSGDMWIIANMGERESWGQKLIRFGSGFADMGFLDVALPERVMEDDTLRLKRRNIGPSMRVSEHNDTAYFRFACDSVFLYDDQAGAYDVVRDAQSVFFTFQRSEGLALWVNGQKRLVNHPA